MNLKNAISPELIISLNDAYLRSTTPSLGMNGSSSLHFLKLHVPEKIVHLNFVFDLRYGYEHEICIHETGVSEP